MEKFTFGTTIYAGSGSISALAELGAKRLFLVADPFFAKNGMARKAAEYAGAEEVHIFDKVTPDPSVQLAAEGTAAIKAFSPDLLVAMGGGSAIDCAKAMLYFSQLDIPFAAIPTTSGSGSEVTDFAILTHDRVKHPLIDPRLRPTAAILDDDLLRSLPKPLIAEAGFDILTHAAESIAATGSTPFTLLFAQEAFRLAFALLPASYAGQTQVRLKIHTASAMAGIAFTQSGLGLCHAMSHSLGGMFHIAHGRLNAILLPAVIAVNARIIPEKYAALARAAGLGGSAHTIALRNLQNGLCRLRRELELPQTLAQAGIPPSAVWNCRNAIVEAALADPCCKTNPLVPEDFVVRRILEEVTGHG